MRCVICDQEETRPGKTTVTLERGDATLVFRGVPAEVCPNCGEAYVQEETSSQLLDLAEAAVRAGVRVDVREFTAVPA